MKDTCEDVKHPPGEPTGQVTGRFANGTTYVEVVCPVCRKVQGIRRVKAVK